MPNQAYDKDQKAVLVDEVVCNTDNDQAEYFDHFVDERIRTARRIGWKIARICLGRYMKLERAFARHVMFIHVEGDELDSGDFDAALEFARLHIFIPDTAQMTFAKCDDLNCIRIIWFSNYAPETIRV